MQYFPLALVRVILLIGGMLLLVTPSLAQGAPAKEVTTLLQQLQDPSAQKRQEAADKLGALRNSAAFDGLRAALQDRDPFVQGAALVALAKVGKTRALPFITPYLQDDIAAVVRGQAVSALGFTGDERAIDYLINTATTPKHDLRLRAIYAAGSLLHDLLTHDAAVQRLFPPLFALLQDTDITIRQAGKLACETALTGNIDNLAIINRLVTALNDPYQEGRLLSLSVLGQCDANIAVPVLIPMLKDNHRATGQVEEVLHSLMRNGMGTKESALLDPLRAMLTGQDNNLRRTALCILNNLRDIKSRENFFAIVQDRNDPLRVEAASALLNIGDETSLQLLSTLKSDAHVALRGFALDAIVCSGSEQAFPTLLDMAADNDAAIRQRVATKLRGYRRPEARDILLQLLHDDWGEVRRAAAASLSAFREPQVGNALIPLLNDTDNRVRAQVLESLGAMNDPRHAVFIAPFLQATDLQVHQSAALALLMLGDPRGMAALNEMRKNKQLEENAFVQLLAKARSVAAIEPLLLFVSDKLLNKQSLSFYNDMIFDAIAVTGMPGIERIAALLADPRPEMRLGAVYACCQLPDARLVPGLILLLKEKDDSLLQMVILALGRIGDGRAITALTEKLTDASPTTKIAIAWEFNQLKDPRTLAPLTVLIQEDNEEVRRAAIWALHSSRDVRAIPIIASVLNDDRGLVREAAVAVLGEIRADTAIAPLLTRIDDPRPEVRREIITALCKIGTVPAHAAALKILETADLNPGRSYPWLVEVDAPELLTPLLATVRHENPVVRALAVRPLGNYRDVRAAAAIRACLVDREEIVRAAAAEALGRTKSPPAVVALQSLLKDPSIKVQAAATRALGENGDPSAIPVLTAQLQSKEQPVKVAAMQALGTLRAVEAIEPMIAAIDRHQSLDEYMQRTVISQALAKMRDPRVLPLLTHFLHTANGITISPALSALGEHGDRRAAPLLLNYLHSGRDLQIPAKYALMQALVKLADPQTAPTFLSLLDGDDVNCRAFAAEGLGSLKDTRATTVLIAALNDASYVSQGGSGYLGGITVRNIRNSTREKAAWALGEIGDTQAVEPLIAALGWGTANDRKAVAEALGKLKDARAIAPLIAQLPHLTGDAHTAACTALATLTGQDLGTDMASWQQWWQARPQ